MKRRQNSLEYAENHGEQDDVNDQHHQALGGAGDEQGCVGTSVHHSQPVGVDKQRDQGIHDASCDTAGQVRNLAVEDEAEQTAEEGIAEGEAEEEGLSGHDGTDDIGTCAYHDTHQGTSEETGTCQHQEGEADLQNAGDADVELGQNDVHGHEETCQGAALYAEQTFGLTLKIESVLRDDVHKKYTSYVMVLSDRT